MSSPFDPRAWLARKGCVASLAADGSVQLLFDEYMRREVRERIRRIIRNWDGLLRLQLDVPPGTRPRTVQQLMAAGRIRIRDGRYVVTLKE
jgi:hypothetical protein